MNLHFLSLTVMARNNWLVRINIEAGKMMASEQVDTALVKAINYTKDRGERHKVVLTCEYLGMLHAVVRFVYCIVVLSQESGCGHSFHMGCYLPRRIIFSLFYISFQGFSNFWNPSRNSLYLGNSIITFAPGLFCLFANINWFFLCSFWKNNLPIN